MVDQVAMVKEARDELAHYERFVVQLRKYQSDLNEAGYDPLKLNPLNIVNDLLEAWEGNLPYLQKYVRSLDEIVPERVGPYVS